VKLEGSLDAFGLPDIFQLLSLTKKTGGLHLRNGASAGVVYFADGSVSGANSNLSRQTLARRLVGTSTASVPDTVLVAAVSRAKAENIGVGRALLDAGAVEPGLVLDAAGEVAVDAVFDLLRWPEGDFAFSVDAVNPDDIGLHLSTDQIVSQAKGRRESLDAATDAIPSVDVVLGVRISLTAEPDLTRDEWALVALADGRRTVADIIELTGRGYFAVVPGLADLVRRGLLEVNDAANDPVGLVRHRLELLAPLEGPRVETPRAARQTNAPAPAAPVAPAARPAPAAAPASAVVAESEPFAADAHDAADADEVADDEAQERELVSTIGGPHVPANVVPPRPEPFLARRQPDHPETDTQPVTAGASRLAFAPSPSPSPTAAAAPESSGSVFSQPANVGQVDAPRGGTMSHGVGGVNGSAAMAADPETAALIERDPSVNRSLLLRLIAGVRGL
jgi:Domain of unknown function (DUF4388)